MKFVKASRLFLPILCLYFFIILSGCSAQNETENPDLSGENADVTDDVVTTLSPSPDADEFFTLNYDPEMSLNPLTGTDHDNMVVSSLLYEGLFAVDENFQPQPVLCEQYSTDDGKTYRFKIKSDVIMSDGTALNAHDVAYSINSARTSGKYSSRLKAIESVTVTDGLSLTVKLSETNWNFTVLLDFPIIADGSADSSIPAGTGPFKYAGGDDPMLVALADYRDDDDLPIRIIKLTNVSASDLPAAFSEQDIDLLQTDPTGPASVQISVDYEAHYYDTTVLQYIGFNIGGKVLSDADVRRAIAYTIDRQEIVKTIYSGRAVAAPLLFNPAWRLYDETWEEAEPYSLLTFSEMLSSVGLEDPDDDGYLEYPDVTGGYMNFSFDFIVNSENEYKVAAAGMITETLRSVGIDVTLQTLSWEDYVSAVEKDNYDLYFGEVMLPADLDYTELLTAGGEMNYGGITGSEYGALIGDFLAAESNAEAAGAAKELCESVAENAPIVPVLYKKHAVLTNRDVVSGMNPTQSDIFFGFTDWEIRLK